LSVSGTSTPLTIDEATVSILDVQIPVTLQHFGRDVEAALDHPVLVRDPLHVPLIAAEIGIGDQTLRPEMRRMHIAGDSAWGQPPGVGVDDGIAAIAGEVDGAAMGCSWVMALS
jgi:hypothetical protein